MANCQIQAEERLKRSVVLVQAMFMSKQAQENYRRMKLTHEEAQVKLCLAFLFSCSEPLNLERQTLNDTIINGEFLLMV